MALTDSSEHLPPTSGTFDYNASPNRWANLTVGQSDTDPVFGEAIRRMTNIGAVSNDTQNYGFPFINADATLMFDSPVAQNLNILRVSDGLQVYTNVPDGIGSRTEMQWSHNNPDVYYYMAGTALHEYTLSTAADVVIKDFGVGNTLQLMGGSMITHDRTDNLFCVVWGSPKNARVWNRSLNLVYTGSVDVSQPLAANGFVGINPDGTFLTAGAFGSSSTGSRLRSFAVDNSAHTVNPAGIEYWSLGGAHSTHVSASDGTNWAVVESSNVSTGVYATDMVTNRSAMSDANQKAGSRLLLPMEIPFQDGFHMCAVVRGSFQDWAFISVERTTGDLDNPGDAPTSANWYPFTQEIVAVNVLTGALRRLCHHRSRGNLNTNYQSQPRNSCSPTGSAVMYSSNMNDITPAGYADNYLIENPLGAAVLSSNISRSGGMRSRL